MYVQILSQCESHHIVIVRMINIPKCGYDMIDILGDNGQQSHSAELAGSLPHDFQCISQIACSSFSENKDGICCSVSV